MPTGRGRDLSDQLLDPVQYETLLNELLQIKLNSKIEVRVTCGPQFSRVVSESKAEKRVGVVRGCMGGCQFGFVSRQGDVQTCGFLDIPAGNLVQNGFDFRAIWERSDLLNRTPRPAEHHGSLPSVSVPGDLWRVQGQGLCSLR